MNNKLIKNEAKHNIKKNYFKNILVVFICTILISGGIGLSSKNILDIDISDSENIRILNKYSIKSNSEILDELIDKTSEYKELEKKVSEKYTHGVLSVLINEITYTKSVLFSILNNINRFLGGKVSAAAIILISNIILLLITLVLSVLEVGKKRYFIKHDKLLNPSVYECIYPYKKKKAFHLIYIIFIKNLYLFLWSFTIVGYFIKKYEYSMIPYLLAENPNISKKDAFRLSKDMTQGNKLNIFKLDVNLLLWKILGFLTFNILNIFFTNIYKETMYASIYVKLREKVKDKKLIDDDYIYGEDILDLLDLNIEKKTLIRNNNYDKKYSKENYILFFFIFCFIGWIWEVLLHLHSDGVFVNRGSLYGPWLPIYGCGGLLILILLKKFRKKPYLMFISSFILCGIVEYSTSWYLEVFRHLKYWDYTGYFLNINGRVCFEGLLIFGLGGCAFTYILAPIFDGLLNKIKLNIRRIICVILLTIFSIDFIYSTFVKPNTGKGITTDVNCVNCNNN